MDAEQGGGPEQEARRSEGLAPTHHEQLSPSPTAHANQREQDSKPLGWWTKVERALVILGALVNVVQAVAAVYGGWIVYQQFALTREPSRRHP